MTELDIKMRIKEKKAEKLQKIRFEALVLPKVFKSLAGSTLSLNVFEVNVVGG